MKKGIFPGSFCPVTKGHVAIIEQCSALVDSLVVVVGHNEKKNYQIMTDDRVTLLKKAVAGLSNVSVVAFSGFMTDFCIENDVDVMFKSIRNESDLQDARETLKVNETFWKNGKTVFLLANEQNQSISSSLVRELVAFNKDISSLVPDGLADEIVQLLKK